MRFFEDRRFSYHLNKAGILCTLDYVLRIVGHQETATSEDVFHLRCTSPVRLQQVTLERTSSQSKGSAAPQNSSSNSLSYPINLIHKAFEAYERGDQGPMNQLTALRLSKKTKLNFKQIYPMPLQHRHGYFFADVFNDYSSSLSDFEHNIYQTIKRIPFGETRSYEQVAEDAGHPKAVRRVGTLCRQNSLPIIIPCHRVVPKSYDPQSPDKTGGGYLGEKFSMMKTELLEAESKILRRQREQKNTLVQKAQQIPTPSHRASHHAPGRPH